MGNNGCVCSKSPSPGPQAAVSCGCAFPINGRSRNREIAFNGQRSGVDVVGSRD